jgi:hypothetical protein
VRVASFKETTRSDESVLYQQAVMVPPGSYGLSFSLRDDAGGKGGSIEASVNIPRMTNGSLSSPIPVYEGSPRSSLDSLPENRPDSASDPHIGQDSTLKVYVEAYGSGTTMPLRARVR